MYKLKEWQYMVEMSNFSPEVLYNLVKSNIYYITRISEDEKTNKMMKDLTERLKNLKTIEGIESSLLLDYARITSDMTGFDNFLKITDKDILHVKNLWAEKHEI